MAINEVSICTNALLKIGDRPITSRGETTDRAVICDNIYDQTRDVVLSAYPWGFAKARASIAASATGPLWGYNNAYALPTDPYCLRVLEIEDSRAIWKVEGRTIATDDTAPLKILYISRATDPTEYSLQFVEAFSARLAAEIAMPLTKSIRLMEDMFKLYDAKMDEARSLDSHEGSQDEVDTGTLVDIRRG